MNTYYLKKFRKEAEENVFIELVNTNGNNSIHKGIIKAKKHPFFPAEVYFQLRSTGWDWRGFYNKWDVQSVEELEKLLKEARQLYIRDLVTEKRVKTKKWKKYRKENEI